MIKTITIDNKEVAIRCSALVPRLYRRATGRDLILDMNTLRTSYNQNLQARAELVVKCKEENREPTSEEAASVMLSVLDLTIFENLAWAVVYDADREHVPADPDEWLDTLEGTFEIYKVLPAIIEVWNESNQQTAVPAKK